MSLELILDILLSVVVLAIYHADCDRPVAPAVAEFHTTPPEAYDYTVIPSTLEPIDEWAIEDEALIMSHPDETQVEIEAVNPARITFEWPKQEAIDECPDEEESIEVSEAFRAWCAESDRVTVDEVGEDVFVDDEPIEVVPITAEAIAACTSLSTDPIEPTPLSEYQAMSSRKLKALAKELAIPKYSRMKQEALAIAVYEATVERDGYPEEF